MKNDKGITLKSLCIVIAICLIIIFVTLNVLNESYKISNLKKYVSEMELLQNSVNDVRENYKLWEKYNPNEPSNFYSYLQEKGFINANSTSNLYKNDFQEIIKKLGESDIEFWNENIDTNIINYCYFTPSDLKKFFNLNNFDHHVIINFYTGNIISKDGIEDISIKKVVYRQYDSSIGNSLKLVQIDSNDITTNIEVIENYGLKQKIRIFLDSIDKENIPNILEVYYLVENENKKRCSTLSDYTYIEEEKSAYVTIETSGDYSFIIEDTNYIQYPKIDYSFELCNPPVLYPNMTAIYWDEENNEKHISSMYDSNWYDYSSKKLKLANARTDDGNYWVWIPRFAYKENLEKTDLEFIINKSFTSTSGKSLIGYKTHSAFEEDENATGFWVAKFQSNVDTGEVKILPGQTLTVVRTSQAKQYCKNMLKFGTINIMSNSKLNAIITLSNSYNLEISNDLVHYAGGSPNQNGYLVNTRYSSTSNVYGVYDLITSENEVVLESHDNEIGRFRSTIIIK